MNEQIEIGGIFGIPEGGSYRKIFFCGWSYCDVMAVSYDTPLGLSATMRLRMYADEDPFSENDSKTTVHIKPKDFAETGEVFEKQISESIEGMTRIFGPYEKFEIVEVFGGNDRMIECLKAQDWCHIKTIKPGVAE